MLGSGLGRNMLEGQWGWQRGKDKKSHIGDR